jgi:glycosyltransferase involved in cell wall biosynthesis
MNLSRLLITTGIYPPDIGGPATYAKTLVDELPQHDFEVRVLNFSSLKKYPQGLRHLIFLFRILRIGRWFDLMLALDTVSVGLPTAIASLLIRKPFVMKVGGDYAWEQGRQRFAIEDTLDTYAKRPLPLQVAALRKVQSWVASRSRSIIAPSQYLKNIVSSWVNSDEKIQVIHNAFSAPDIKITKDGARKQLNISNGMIVSMGRLVPWKGFSTLIDVMPDLLNLDPDIRLFIIGSGPEEENLRTKIRELGLGKQIILQRELPHSEALSYLLAADAFILNTSYEGLSHTILEAMAVGTPVITTSAGGNSELIQHEISGLIIPYNNKSAIISGIMRLLEDNQMRLRVIDNAFGVVGNFSRASMIKQTIEHLAPA